MILTGEQIRKEIKENNIFITPFHESYINPDSYDISIGEKLFFYSDDIVLDSRNKNIINCVNIPKEGYILQKNKFYYAESLEKIQTMKFVPLLHSKSGVARLGLFVHITADLLDRGHNGNVLLQLYSSNNVRIYPNQRLGQLSFWRVQEK